MAYKEGRKTGQPRAKANYRRLRESLGISEDPIFTEASLSSDCAVVENVSSVRVNKEYNSVVVEASNPTIKDKPSSSAAATTLKLSSVGASTKLAPTLWAKAQSLELISSVFVVENLETKDNLENYVSLAAAFPQQSEMTAAFPPPPPPVFALQKEQGKKTLAFSAPSLALSLQLVMISLDIIRITGGEANESLHTLLEEAIPAITLPTSSSHVRTITDEVPEAYMPRLAYNEMATT
ncbi:hypothetical protein ACFE04_021423 [Oxalis oulophora]